MPKWNESNRLWEPDETLLSPEELAHCTRACDDERYRTPIPTQMVSNGEYLPSPQTEAQKRVEAGIHELAAEQSRRLGTSRRRFLAGTGGMAASFLAINKVFGPFFKVDPLEMLVPAAYAQGGAPRNLFVFDDQLHLVRGSRGKSVGALRGLAEGPSIGPSLGLKANPFNPAGHLDEHGETWGVWNPALVGLPFNPENFLLTDFIRQVYLDSQVTVGMLTNVPASVIDTGKRAPRNVVEARGGEILTAAQTAAARDFINEVAGSRRSLAHGMLYVGKGNLDYIHEQIEQNRPDSWKGYNIANAAKVNDNPLSLMKQWRHDDEEIAYPTFEAINRAYSLQKVAHPGFNNICVHKGLVNSKERRPEIGHPADLPKAARDWPNLNFITYHACIQPSFFMYDALAEIQAGKLREGVPDISWTTEYALLCRDFKNTYAELGTTWASSIITFPTVAAHIMGQLLKFMGPDRIVFGSDSVWYGSPQWQIEAMWRFQIPEEMQRKYGYPAFTEEHKRKILGLNSARLYGIAVPRNLAAQFKPMPTDYAAKMSDSLKHLMEMPGYTADKLSQAKERYEASGGLPDHTRYGWVRTS
ncbi:MAG TPA: amidohydrolase family protein [Steroidobacteraceae bacterium]|nr:amidohydrolase family protein [Steroidobacteraceae bacterium]